MVAKILPCKCKNDYQDEKYGKGNRVHNPMAKAAKSEQQYRCVICASVRTAPSSSIA